MNISKLETIILDQRDAFEKKEIGIPRVDSVKPYTDNPRIVVISGVRRCGKSTLLRQFADHVRPYYYLTFEDERLLSFTVEDFQNLMLIWQKQFSAKTVLLDEIQNIPKWELFVRRIQDQGYKVYITGSNANLLSSELATHLTGRYLTIELYPFSFDEYLNLHGINHTTTPSTAQQAKILRAYEDYLQEGGFPEKDVYHNPDILKKTYEDIIYRDIITRFKIRDTKTFRQMASYLFSNIGKETSYNNIRNMLNIATTSTVREYIHHMQEAYMIFELYKYDFSLKKQYTSDKKIYCIDSGMRKVVSFHHSQDRGRVLENTVFLELKRRGHELYFFKHNHECDFLIYENGIIKTAIQVTTSLSFENREREIKGLKEAYRYCNPHELLILTDYQNEMHTEDGMKIQVTPIWKWLLQQKQ